MAEGGFDPTDPTTDKTPLIPKDDDDATNPWDSSDLSQIPVTEDPTHDTDSTQPFEPGAASTPSGEQIPMATRTRLPQSVGLSSPKPLSAVSQQQVWHGVRLNRSSRWLKKANLRCVTNQNPEQGMVVAL